MNKVYIYVVDRDLGFAPNPFHGYCTLATCKPAIRKVAKLEDWVIGMGGSRLKATGKCIFAMKVTQKVTFNEYWTNPKFNDKKPVSNGSKRMLLGDNIYHQQINGNWSQAHSHHSYENGSTNVHNLQHDTESNNVLISDHFYYFGSGAPVVPTVLLDNVGYKNCRRHRTFDFDKANDLVCWIDKEYVPFLNRMMDNPFDFDKSSSHYSVETNRITVVVILISLLCANGRFGTGIKTRMITPISMMKPTKPKSESKSTRSLPCSDPCLASQTC